MINTDKIINVNNVGKFATAPTGFNTKPKPQSNNAVSINIIPAIIAGLYKPNFQDTTPVIINIIMKIIIESLLSLMKQYAKEKNKKNSGQGMMGYPWSRLPFAAADSYIIMTTTRQK